MAIPKTHHMSPKGTNQFRLCFEFILVSFGDICYVLQLELVFCNRSTQFHRSFSVRDNSIRILRRNNRFDVPDRIGGINRTTGRRGLRLTPSQRSMFEAFFMENDKMWAETSGRRQVGSMVVTHHHVSSFYVRTPLHVSLQEHFHISLQEHNHRLNTEGISRQDEEAPTSPVFGLISLYS